MLVFNYTALPLPSIPLDGESMSLIALAGEPWVLSQDQVQQSRWFEAGFRSTHTLGPSCPPVTATETLCPSAGWKSASPGALEPSTLLCPYCHQGHLLGLTDGSEKPIKWLLPPVLCYRKAAWLTRAGSSSHNWRKFSRHPVLCVAALALLGPSLPSRRLFSPPSEADLISTLSFCPPCHVSFPRSSQEPQSQQAICSFFLFPRGILGSYSCTWGRQERPCHVLTLTEGRL